MNRVRVAMLALAAAASLTATAAPAWAGKYRVVYRPHGNMPSFEGSFAAVGGILYGTARLPTSSDGAVCSLDPATGTATIVYPFNQSGGGGSFPTRGLTDVGGTLYGTTEFGGASGVGTVFSVDTATGAGHIVYSFPDGRRGYFPSAAPVSAGGRLFGVADGGGTPGGGGADRAGIVYSVDPATGAEKVVYAFQAHSADGELPVGTPLKHAGVLYGATEGGGPANSGTVYALDPRTGSETVLYSFKYGTDGASPSGNLIMVDGLLYGSTSSGGAAGEAADAGTIFSVDPKTGTEQILHSFLGGADGATPFQGLLRVGALLYGTTIAGGATNYGTLFSVEFRTGVERVVHTFRGGSDGAYPVGELIDVNGTLYGATVGGGSPGCSYCGTVFAFTP
jgi:uncharacterized repeat protein (TIGR03803 family)